MKEKQNKKEKQNIEEKKQAAVGRRCLELFLTFGKIGAFTFGGGYAMISLIQAEIAERKKWIKKEEVLDMVAIAESTPGPIAINCATFVGYKRAGSAGSLCATLGVVLPSFVIISILAAFIREFKDLEPVAFAFEGIRVGVVVLVLKAFLSMWKSCQKNGLFYLVCLGAFLAVSFFNISPVLVIVCGGITGLVMGYAGLLTMDKKGE